MKKVNCFENDFMRRTQNTSFSPNQINGPNKLEYYIRLGWKGLQGKNTLACCACL